MALEISPIDSFNQIKNINQMLSRKRTPIIVKKEPEKRVFNRDDEIDLRALILENTSTSELTRITSLIEVCKNKGYHEENVIDVLRKMIAEKLLDTLNERFLLRLDDTD